MARRPRPLERFVALSGADASGVRQSLVALVLNSSTSLVAGAVLGSVTATLERLPGLLVMVPAAIGLRGNIFGSFGSRISTTIHSGTFRLSARRESVLGQNIWAVAILTLSISALLAAIAKAIGVGLGLPHTISVLDLAIISIVGGILGSIVVVASTLGLTAGAVRYGWDLDNVVAPLVSTLGDVLTLPALLIATALVGLHIVTPVLGAVLVAIAAAALVLGWRSKLDELRRIVRESMPVLLVAAAVSAMAGITLEKRFGSFSDYPALLVLVPAHLSSAGALGGILTSRLASKLFLGTVDPSSTPTREARREFRLVLTLAVPVYLFNAVGAHYVGRLIGEASPGLPLMIGASMIGGAVAMAFVVGIAYYGTIVAYRTGLDPDTYGIPVVSSSVDFIGAFTLILAIALLGIA